MPYEATGRVHQKRRTRQALVGAARELVAAGYEPSVEQAAERAGIARTTAYRYFPNHRSLVLAAHPETGARTLLPEDPPSDAADRLDLVVTNFIQLIIDTEPAQRTMLRLSLEPDPTQRGELPLRKGRAIAWIAEALEPLRECLTREQLHGLVLAIRSVIGIEALAWLTDVGGLTRDDAAASMRWSAHALLAAARTTGPLPTGPTHVRRPGDADRTAPGETREVRG
jgi:AcrR family transcriptional regulator